jgi:ATP-dependent RNA helicase DHX29
MLRLSLQDLVLRVKICNLGEIEDTLLEALDPPSSKNIRRAIESLKEVKALTSAEGLTALGKQLAKLPLDVWLGKLIIYGAIFKCLDACVSIAAILSSKSPFVNTLGSNAQRDAARLSFKRGTSRFQILLAISLIRDRGLRSTDYLQRLSCLEEDSGNSRGERVFVLPEELP